LRSKLVAGKIWKHSGGNFSDKRLRRSALLSSKRRRFAEALLSDIMAYSYLSNNNVVSDSRH
jgi:hypothetical protein